MIIKKAVYWLARSHNEKWERNFALWEQFYNEFGRFPMQKDIYHDVKLGLWCANQRRDVAGDTCLPEREARLREIGLIPRDGLSFF
jgi:hypothetical protein